MFGLIEVTTTVYHVQYNLGFFAAEAEYVIESLGEFLFVWHREQAASAVGMAEGSTTNAEDKRLHHHAAELHLPRHVANLCVAIVHTVGDNQYQVAAGTRGREVAQRVGQRLGRQASTLRHEGLYFALQAVYVVCTEGDFEACAKLLLVEVSEDAKGHVDVVLARDAVKE